VQGLDPVQKQERVPPVAYDTDSQRSPTLMYVKIENPGESKSGGNKDV